MNIMERVDATQKTIDQFIEKPFRWGEFDCGYLASTHLENCNFETPLKSVAGYSTERGAKRALAKLKAKGMDELVDRQGFDRIAAASTLPGDIVGLPGGEPGNEWIALGIVVGNGSIIAFANGVCMRGPVDVATIAWRVA